VDSALQVTSQVTPLACSKVKKKGKLEKWFIMRLKDFLDQAENSSVLSPLIPSTSDSIYY